MLPGPQLLERMAEALGPVGGVEIHQRLLFAGGSGRTVNETLHFNAPDFFRFESRTEDSHRIHVVAAGQAVTIMDGRCISDSPDPWNRYTDLLFCRSRALLVEKLGLSGVDVTVSSLGRFEGRVCRIIGARYPELSAPQVWLDKDSFFPLRLLMPKTAPDGSLNLLEFRYLEWRKTENFWYPGRIQVLEGDTPVREIVADEVRSNAVAADALFDLEALRRQYPAAEGNSSEPGTPEESDEIHKTIEDFKKRFEP